MLIMDGMAVPGKPSGRAAKFCAICFRVQCSDSSFGRAFDRQPPKSSIPPLATGSAFYARGLNEPSLRCSAESGTSNGKFSGKRGGERKEHGNFDVYYITARTLTHMMLLIPSRSSGSMSSSDEVVAALKANRLTC